MTAADRMAAVIDELGKSADLEDFRRRLCDLFGRWDEERATQVMAGAASHERDVARLAHIRSARNDYRDGRITLAEWLHAVSDEEDEGH